MTRYRVTIEYDGTNYVGWQRQTNGPSIQEAVEEAIRTFSGEVTQLFGAGRTDAGVHALGQVGHFDLDGGQTVDTIRQAVNFHLKPAPIVILDVHEAPNQFHARFSAIARCYQYRILNRAAPPALSVNRAWHVPRILDVHAMQTASQCLVGRHDFTTFRSSQCQANSPIRTLDALNVTRHGTSIEVVVKARSFLHNQVRSIVGTLKRVGEGAMSINEVASALAACNRSAAGPTAPAHGLYLAGVNYPTELTDA